MLPGIQNSRTNGNAVRAVAYVLADLDLEYKARELGVLVPEKLASQTGSVQADTAQVAEVVREKIKEAASTLKG